MHEEYAPVLNDYILICRPLTQPPGLLLAMRSESTSFKFYRNRLYEQN